MDEDLRRPPVRVAHGRIEVTPCNSNHRKPAEKVKWARLVWSASGGPVTG